MNENFCLGQLCAIPAASISIHHAGVTALQFKVNRCTMGTNAFCDIGNAVTSKPAFFNYLAVSQCQMSSAQSLSGLLSSIFAQKNNAKETMPISFAFSLIFQLPCSRSPKLLDKRPKTRYTISVIIMGL